MFVVKDTSTPVAKQGKQGKQESMFVIHPGILIVGLLFLVFFIIVSIILIVLHIKERRRRHYLAEEYDTPLPIKSEYAIPGVTSRTAVGEKERILGAGGRSPRPSTSSPLPHHVRKSSGTGSGGGGSSLRYQQSSGMGAGFHEEIPGYSAGHSVSVYYAEPWSGCSDGDSKDPRPRHLNRGTPPLSPHPDSPAHGRAGHGDGGGGAGGYHRGGTPVHHHHHHHHHPHHHHPPHAHVHPQHQQHHGDAYIHQQHPHHKGSPYASSCPSPKMGAGHRGDSPALLLKSVTSAIHHQQGESPGLHLKGNPTHPQGLGISQTVHHDRGPSLPHDAKGGPPVGTPSSDSSP